MRQREEEFNDRPASRRSRTRGSEGRSAAVVYAVRRSAFYPSRRRWRTNRRRGLRGSGGDAAPPAAVVGISKCSDGNHGFSLVCVLLSLWLLIGPVFAYINIGQAKKIEIIRGFFSPDLIARYFDQFWQGRDGFAALMRRWRAQRPNLSPDLTAELETKFAGLFRDDFGLSVYLVPSVLLTAVGFIVLFFGYAGGIALAEAMVNPGGLPPITPLGLQLDLVSVAAIFGAFTWIVSDSITRNHQWTFHPSDLSWYALRLIIAVPWVRPSQ